VAVATGVPRRHRKIPLPRALGKTAGRAADFLVAALVLRDQGRPYAPLAYALFAAAVWLLVGVMGEPDRLAIMMAAAVLFGLLVAICAIDARFGIIPDSLVIALALVGGVHVVATGIADPLLRAAEAAIVLVAAWLFRAGYYRARGHHGLGLGDVKLLAAGVLWTGVASVPAVILIAVASALVCLAVVRAQGHRLSGQNAIAFGPHLALGMWLGWIAGVLRVSVF
jgi:leader peptidase (prepilin peptidase)/N-methyltransferase